MKKHFLNYTLYGIIILSFMNCRYETSTHESHKHESYIRTKTQAEFVYSNGDKKIELILELERDSILEIGKPINANLKTENIDKQNLMIFGPGIKVNKVDNSGFRFTITPIDKTLVYEKLEIQVTERIENGESFSHKFLVPTKQKIIKKPIKN